MKSVSAICVATMVLAGVLPARVANATEPEQVALDAVVVRPLCFAATVAGSVIFVVSLPVAATSHSIKPTAEALVMAPGRETFKRPLGYFGYDDPPSKQAGMAAKSPRRATQTARLENKG